MTPLLQPLPWQETPWLDLTSQLLQGRLHHGLLFTGPQGVGKRHFIRALAAFVLCEQRSGYACGHCHSCTQFLVGTQPNASWVSLDGHGALAGTADGRHELALMHWQPEKDRKKNDISIGAVRSLIQFWSMASHQGRARLAVIDPADDLNESSANALLKTLEEPGSHSHLWLVTERLSALKPTLRSRCQILRFPVPPPEQARQWLEEQDVRDAATALSQAQGAPLKALQWARSGRAEQSREWERIMSELAQRKRDPVSAAADIGKDLAVEFTGWLSAWLTDQLRQALVAAQPARALEQILVDSVECQRRLNGNGNPQLLLESLLIRWWQLSGRKR